jgi:hypothetical protein
MLVPEELEELELVVEPPVPPEPPPPPDPPEFPLIPLVTKGQPASDSTKSRSASSRIVLRFTVTSLEKVKAAECGSARGRLYKSGKRKTCQV